MTERIEPTPPAWAPPQPQGMTLRDYFASTMDRDEYADVSFRNLSIEAKEHLAGKRPERPRVGEARNLDYRDYYLAEMRWEMAVRAAIRFIYADAMLAAREARHD